MKSAMVALVMAVTVLAQNPPPPAPQEDPGAKKARQLIEQTILALGGQAYLSVLDMEQQGRTYSFYHGQPASVGAPFWRFWRWPDKDRVELTKQRDVVYINNGDAGFEITYKGTALQEAQQLQDYNRRRQYTLELVLRQWLKQPGTMVLYEGSSVAEQKPCETVSVINAQNQTVTLFLDVNSHLPVKKVFYWRDKDRYKNEEAEVFDNYRPIQGVMTPHGIIRARNGEYVSQRFIHSVRYNVGLTDSLFTAAPTYDPYKSERKK